jgi:hypothetical protein
VIKESNMRLGLAGIACVVLAGCASLDINYTPPAPISTPPATVKVIDRPRDAVWNSSVPQLGKQSLVINSLDKSSGVVSISYSGDLSNYIDCGHVISHVSIGNRTDDFPYSTPEQIFYAHDPQGRLVFIWIHQRMVLEAHANLVFEELSPGQTRVSASTLYTVRREQLIAPDTLSGTTHADVISFNSGGGAFFPTTGDDLPSQCIATGSLERELLSMIQ